MHRFDLPFTVRHFAILGALISGLTGSGGVPAYAAPAQIVIIRHGEKPATGDELDPQGCERAFSLPSFFENNPVVNQFGTPVAAFASQPDHAGSSLRPVETITPTAQALGLAVQDPATRLDYTAIVNAVMNNPGYTDSTVLISWEHDAIPGLAQALGATLTGDEQSWPDVVFDEAWVLDFGATVSLQIIPEDALPGDNPLGGANWITPPGPLGAVSPELSSLCVNNNVLDALAASLAVPPLSGN